MRYSLLASASFLAVVFTMSAPAQAADCGCRDAVRAALAKEKVERAPLPAVKKTVARKAAAKKPVMKMEAAKSAPPLAHNAPPAAGDCGCRDTVRAALAQEMVTQAAPAPEMTPAAPAADAEAFYDYASAAPIDMYPFTHHWAVAPQGYVPPMAMAPQFQGGDALSANAPVSFADAAMPDGEAPNLPPAAPDASASPAAGASTAYAYAGDSGAVPAPAPPPSYEAGITIEQTGWIGGVGRAALFGGGGGGGGGGDGGQSIALARPDSLNGPSYNSFNESYGGDYQSADVINQMRQQAFTPPPAPATPSTGTASH